MKRHRYSISDAVGPNKSQTPRSFIVLFGFAQIVSWGAVYYLFALLIVPLERELGVSRSAIAGAFSVSLLASGLAAPAIGRHIDAHGGRAVMSIGALASALLLAALSQVHSVLALYAIWALLGVAMAATLYESAFAVVTQVFAENYRRAITTLTLFGGFASTVFWPLTAKLIEWFGWRNATLVLAGIVALLTLPVYAFAIPRRAAHALDRFASRDDGLHVEHAVWRDRRFVAFAASFTVQALALTGIGVHLLTLFDERGLSVTVAATLGAMIGPMQVAGRALELAVSGRLSAVEVGRIAVVLLPLSLIVLLFAGTNLYLLGLFSLLYGAGNGAMTIVRGAAPVELFGRERYGALSGWIAMPAMFARAAGPLLAAALWSAFGGYGAVLAVLGACTIMAAVFYWAAVQGK
jgi:MFS family permease